MITIVDKITREIDIIDTIFRCQFSEFNPENYLLYPTIMDKSGKVGINGRYISWMDIYSDVTLLEIQEFKRHVTERFDNATRLDLLKIQLIEIQKKAAKTLGFFYENLTGNALLFQEYQKTAKKLYKVMNDEYFSFTDEHKAVVTISEYPMVKQVWMGVDQATWTGRSRHKYKFYYIATNQFFADVCKNIIDFINKVLSLIPSPPAPDQEPTAPVKALFIYYLSQSKVIHFPQKGVFEGLMGTYHFKGSVINVYNHFRALDRGESEIMNMKNLKSVIELLNPYPTALRKAENDLYQIECESREAPADLS